MGPLADALAARSVDDRANDPVWLAFVDDHLDELAELIAADPTNDPDWALHAGALLWRYWMVRGNWAEGIPFLDGALEASTDRQTIPRVRVLYGRALLAMFKGDLDASLPFEQEGLSLAEELDDWRGIGDILNIIGGNQAVAGVDPVIVQSLLGRSLAAYKRIGDDVGMAEAHINLAELARSTGDLAGALTHNLEIIAIGRARNDRMLLGNSLGNTAYIYRAQGDNRTATTYYIESLTVTRELGFPPWVAYGLVTAGGVLVSLKQYADAARMMSAGIAAFPESEQNLDTNDAAQVDADIARIKTAIGIRRFEAVWLEGSELSPGDAIDEAIELLTRSLAND